ncbi:NYN domain-containing protein [Alkalibacter rhizosphaerae]|uniref:NYN domain-containing protein n=1 Tax=Alkalibacter rhizosphaerae TaxID=2815577 RepID=A0A975AGL5_9FIRM|nr:NYN domain-containing protein [Alkalibacter rhizosphaerae]QSX07507.1 NYN domain-containing protein [Alkalibacter rhizosphaerae]
MKGIKHFLVVDGYNIINHWDRLKGLMDHSLEDARDALVDLMQGYAKLKNLTVVVVFDAYNNSEMAREENIHGIKVVYSGKNQTADSYIEKFIYDLHPLHEVTVATSDFMLQKMILAAGGIRISARELEKEVEFALRSSMKKISRQQSAEKNKLAQHLDQATLQRLLDFTGDNKK